MNSKEGEPIDPFKEINKDLYINFSTVALRGDFENQIYSTELLPIEEEKERLPRIDIDLATDDSAMDFGEGSEFPAGNAPKDFETPYIAIEKYHGIWLSDETVDTPYGFFPKAFDTSDGTAGYLLRNTYLISESGKAIKYYQVSECGPDDETMKVDVSINEESGYMPLKPGDYEFLAYILSAIRNGRLR